MILSGPIRLSLCAGLISTLDPSTTVAGLQQQTCYVVQQTAFVNATDRVKSYIVDKDFLFLFWIYSRFSARTKSANQEIEQSIDRYLLSREIVRESKSLPRRYLVLLFGRRNPSIMVGISFPRPVGPYADTKELEYVSALHQTASDIRQNGTIRGEQAP